MSDTQTASGATPPLPARTPVICGPTAGGKSDLAVDLAIALRERRGIAAEIVTADAFQVYAGLDIGTAKPTVGERRGVPHHLIDVVPEMLSAECRVQSAEPFTLDTWLKLARETMASLRARSVLPIVVGGTHLYVKALLEGLFEGPEPDHALRTELAAMDPTVRRAELERVDPDAARRIHPNDARRTIRALEVFRLTGKPISAHQTQWDREAVRASAEAKRRGGGRGGEGALDSDSASSVPPHPPRVFSGAPASPYLLVILDWETEALNRRINARVKQMMERGLLDEVRGLLDRGGFTAQSAEALGYKQLIPIVRGVIDQGRWPPAGKDVEDAVEKIKIETRRFAKNQRTWLRRLSSTPGSIKLSCPRTPEAPRDAWVDRIVAALGLPV